MKNIAIDDNAHRILNWAKERCIEEGIERPNLSDAIRQLRQMIDTR